MACPQERRAAPREKKKTRTKDAPAYGSPPYRRRALAEGGSIHAATLAPAVRVTAVACTHVTCSIDPTRLTSTAARSVACCKQAVRDAPPPPPLDERPQSSAHLPRIHVRGLRSRRTRVTAGDRSQKEQVSSEDTSPRLSSEGAVLTTNSGSPIR